MLLKIYFIISAIDGSHYTSELRVNFSRSGSNDGFNGFYTKHRIKLLKKKKDFTVYIYTLFAVASTYIMAGYNTNSIVTTVHTSIPKFLPLYPKLNDGLV